MNRLKMLALLAAVVGLLIEEMVDSDSLLIKVNDVAWNVACKELKPEGFYVLVKSYERKIQNEWK